MTHEWYDSCMLLDSKSKCSDVCHNEMRGSRLGPATKSRQSRPTQYIFSTRVISGYSIEMGIVIHHLQNSRSFRIVWLLNELGLDYDLKIYPRIENKAPPEFKALHPLGKSPLLEDNGTQLIESGNIAEYLVGKSGATLSQEERMWMYYSEGTLMLHALAITYARWSLTGHEDKAALAKCEDFMSKNVQNDLDYLESALAKVEQQDGELFLVGRKLSAADVMMAFSVEFAIKKNLGIQGRSWARIHQWLAGLEKRPAYVKARREAPHEL